MKGFAAEYERFMASRTWRKCRKAYAASKQGLCEDCREQGILTPGAEVHHMIKLTARNLNDASVSLNWDNLRLLCKPCHEKREGKRQMRTDEFGRVEL